MERNMNIRKPRSFWPYAIILFFMFIIGLNVTFLALAAGGYTGILETQPYEKGLTYEDELKKLKTFEHLNIKLSIEPSPLRVLLKDEKGTPAYGYRVHFSGKRSNSRKEDFEIEMTEQAPGEYSAPGRLLTPGLWFLEMEIRKGDEIMRVKRLEMFDDPFQVRIGRDF